MTEAHAHVDKPEPRWQALLAMVAVGGIYLALPRELVIGPTWLLPTVIAVLLAPTIVTHRMGRHSFNHALEIVNKPESPVFGNRLFEIEAGIQPHAGM